MAEGDGRKVYDALLKSYRRQALSYDQRWHYYNSATLRATMEAMPRGTSGRGLDAGCGTGLLEEAIQRIHPHFRVIGVDLSLSMLRQARSKSWIANHGNWCNALSEELPFSSGSIDGVVCANSFHYFRQPLRAVEEFRRVLRPNGWLVLTDWCDDFLTCRICNWVLKVVDPARFRMYGMKQCENLLSAAGFQIERARRFKIDRLWGLMTFRACIESAADPASLNEK